MKKHILQSSIALAICLAATTSFAQNSNNPGPTPGDQPPAPEKVIKDLDTDKDGKISLKEVKGPLKDDFKKVDLNNDGYITKEELEKAPPPKGGKPGKVPGTGTVPAERTQ